jgi:hypothetical protein
MREAFTLRIRGEAEQAEVILRRTLPPLVVQWSSIDTRDKLTKKRSIEQAMEEEQRRAEEAYDLVEAVSEGVVNRLAERLEERLESLLQKHLQALAENRSPEAQADVEEYFLSLAERPFAPVPDLSPLNDTPDHPAKKTSPAPQPATAARAPRRIPIGDIAQMIDYVKEQEAAEPARA